MATDLLILTDATASMGAYLEALNNSLPEIIRISSLTGCFARIGVVAYRDYSGGVLTEWSGWYAAGNVNDDSHGTTSRDDMLKFVKSLHPNNGGDWPEATKTGLALAFQNMRVDAKTIVLLYTDAPPHTPATGGTNRAKEQTKLTSGGKYGPSAPKFVDWVSAANTLRDGGAQVFSIVHSHLADTLAPYTFLAAKTRGVCLQIKDSNASVISKLTLGVLLAWMGIDKQGVKPSLDTVAQLSEYEIQESIEDVQSENDDLSKTYWVKEDKEPIVKLVKENLRKTPVSIDTLKQFVPARKPAMKDFSQRYREDGEYSRLVIKNLQEIIQHDVAAVTVNPVFGSLWRTVCNDRLSEARDELIQIFGSSVEAIADAEKKAKMKAWLEESYDYAGEILETIHSVPEADRFPCLLLDPTLDFGKGEDGAENEFTREELLEIGRSCDYRILRRLGKVLTRMTYVATKDDLPAHIKNESEEKVPLIPLALVESKHKAQFWKILLHAFLPGTKLSPRPAALVAALSLRMGMLPLRDAADKELVQWKNKWNTLDIPETWNTNCLSLILEADNDYETRVKSGITKRATPDAAFLGHEDRRLFKTLVEYKMTEMNLDTSLTARIGWQPEKSKAAVGPTVACNACHYSRSVTIMGRRGICGLCDEDAGAGESAEELATRREANVTKGDDEQTKHAWVECSVTVCRAQYVVYNPDKLNVRAKCHYCRASGRMADDMATPSTAPVVECKQCLSRIIWPAEYRLAELGWNPHNNKEIIDFICPACTSGVATTIDILTTASKLASENGRAWLLRNDENKISAPFSGRTSLFYVISSAGIENFADRVEILPALAEPPKLAVKGKLVRNPEAVLTELRGWIDRRRTQSDTCSLCFSDFKKRDLRLACGRTGCVQRICQGCLGGWYGLNSRGKILNVAALSCPFCRRTPTPKTVSAFGLNYLGNLRLAVEEAGQWVYAWCNDCGLARRFIERVCAQGPPAEVTHWRCEECQTKKGTPGGLRVKNCPGCGSPTEKSGGCDHIDCTICNEHWCFNCGEKVSEEDIYEHLYEVHGGLYDGGNDYDDELD